MRIHHSTMVRVDAVVRIGMGSFSSLTVVLADGAVARVGRTYTIDVMERFMKKIESRRLRPWPLGKYHLHQAGTNITRDKDAAD